jgi:hypothetical protein
MNLVNVDFLFSKFSIWLEDPLGRCYICTGVSSKGVKWLGPEADYLPQSDAVVKMRGSVSRILPCAFVASAETFSLLQIFINRNTLLNKQRSK